MRMVNERKVTKDHPQTRTIIMLKLVERGGQVTAGRTFIITELFQGHGRVGRSSNVVPFCSFSKRGLFRRARLWQPLCVIKDGATGDRKQRDERDDDKRQVSFHQLNSIQAPQLIGQTNLRLRARQRRLRGFSAASAWAWVSV